MKYLLILGGLLTAASLIAPAPVKADGDDHRGERRYYVGTVATIIRGTATKIVDTARTWWSSTGCMFRFGR
jgi:hypothetical protein